MYSAGSVKKIIQRQLKRLFYEQSDTFLLLCADEAQLVLALVQRKSAGEIEDEQSEMHGYEIRQLACESKSKDDELFYQEALYRFCRDTNTGNLPTYIFVSDALVWTKTFEFPPMPKRDLEKALSWEVADLQDKYAFGYKLMAAGSRAETEGESELQDLNVVNAVFIEKDYLAQWKLILREQNLTLAGIVVAENSYSGLQISNSKDIVQVVVDEAYLVQADAVTLIKNNLTYLAHDLYINFNADETEATLLNWRSIRLILAVIMVAVSCFSGGYMAMSYSELNEAYRLAAERLTLLHDDMATMQQLQQLEAQVKRKQQLLKLCYEQSSPFYPLLINLSVQPPAGIKLDALTVEQAQMRVQGKAADYEAIAHYKEQLTKISWLKTVEIEASVSDSTEQLIEFSLLLTIN